MKKVYKFLDYVGLTDKKSDSLSVPKIMTWTVAIAMTYILSTIGSDNADLSYIAGVLTTLTAVFASFFHMSLDRNPDDPMPRIPNLLSGITKTETNRTTETTQTENTKVTEKGGRCESNSRKVD